MSNAKFTDEKLSNAEQQVNETVSSDTGNAEEKKSPKKKKGGNTTTLLLMTGLSLLIMLGAVAAIYFIIRNNPDLVHTNDQVVSESQGYINPNSIQQLEYDNEKFTIEAPANSELFIVFGIVFMVIIFISFIFVKVKDRKDEENE